MKYLYAPAIMVLTLVSAHSWANGGHFKVDDASITPSSVCQLESWLSRDDSANVGVLKPACNFTGGSEWSLPVSYDLSSDEALGLGLEYKTVWLDTGSGPALAFDAGFNYSLAADELEQVYLNLPISLQVLENLTLHANVGGLHDRLEDENYGTWGLAATWTTINGPKLIAEVADNHRAEPIFGLGARFGLGTTRWTLDLGAAHNSNSEENTYTLGLNIPRLF